MIVKAESVNLNPRQKLGTKCEFAKSPICCSSLWQTPRFQLAWTCIIPPCEWLIQQNRETLRNSFGGDAEIDPNSEVCSKVPHPSLHPPQAILSPSWLFYGAAHPHTRPHPRKHMACLAHAGLALHPSPVTQSPPAKSNVYLQWGPGRRKG